MTLLRITVLLCVVMCGCDQTSPKFYYGTGSCNKPQDGQIAQFKDGRKCIEWFYPEDKPDKPINILGSEDSIPGILESFDERISALEARYEKTEGKFENCIAPGGPCEKAGEEILLTPEDKKRCKKCGSGDVCCDADNFTLPSLPQVEYGVGVGKTLKQIKCTCKEPCLNKDGETGEQIYPTKEECEAEAEELRAKIPSKVNQCDVEWHSCMSSSLPQGEAIMELKNEDDNGEYECTCESPCLEGNGLTEGFSQTPSQEDCEKGEAR